MYTLEHQGHLTLRLAMRSFPTDKIIKIKDQKQEWMTPTVSWIVCISQIYDLCFIFIFFISLLSKLSCIILLLELSSMEIVRWLFFIQCAQAKWKKQGLKSRSVREVLRYVLILFFDNEKNTY